MSIEITDELVQQLNSLVVNGQIGVGDFRRYLVMCSRPTWSKEELAKAVRQTVRAIESSLHLLCDLGLVVKVRDNEWSPKFSSPMIDPDQSLNQSVIQDPKTIQDTTSLTGETNFVSDSDLHLATKVRHTLNTPVSVRKLAHLIAEETAETPLEEERVLYFAELIAGRHKMGEIRNPIGYFRTCLRTEVENIKAAQEIPCTPVNCPQPSHGATGTQAQYLADETKSSTLERALAFIRYQVPKDVYSTWFTKLKGIENQGKLTIHCANQLAKDWLEARYLQDIQYAVAKAGGDSLALELAC